MPMGGFGGFNFMFTLIPILIVGVIIFVIVSSAARYSKNASSPVLTTRAKVIGKRMEVHGDHAHTWYYVSFEKEDGERIELTIKGQEYGLLAEGDDGMLTWQGEWFKEFNRVRF